MTLQEAIFYLRNAAILWLAQNKEDPNAPKVLEAIQETETPTKDRWRPRP